MIKIYLKIQDSFTRPNEFLPDMSGGQTELHEDWNLYKNLNISKDMDHGSRLWPMDPIQHIMT